MEKKQFNNDRQLAKYANQKSLMDVVDTIDETYQSNGKTVTSKKVIFNINASRDGKQHKEKFGAAHLDAVTAHLLAEEIITGRFKESLYGVKKDNQEIAGAFTSFGGGKMARVFNIFHSNGRYTFSVSLWHPKVVGKGAVTPDKTKPMIDSHSIQLSEWDAKIFMNGVKLGIEARLAVMAQGGQAKAPAPAYTPPPAQTQSAPPPKQAELEDEFDAFTADFDKMIQGLD